MGATLPRKPLERLAFLKGRMALWASEAVAIGSSTSAITNLTALVDACDAAAGDVVTTRGAAEAATIEFRIADEAMTKAAADVIKSIKAKAAVAGDTIYAAAQLPAPAIPGPIGAPGTPANFTVSLRPDGSLEFGWKCVNPAGSHGTIYQVARKIGAAGVLAVIGSTGSRKFIDATLPAGAAAAEGGVLYQVTAMRSTLSGVPGTCLVQFGVAGGTGTMTATLSAPKLAA